MTFGMQCGSGIAASSRGGEDTMADEKVVKCPLCGGLSHIEDSRLLKALTEPRIRVLVENYVNSLLRNPAKELAGVAAGAETYDFQKEVHSWNPNVPMWRRSSKE
jgi:hypothetical protein